MERIDIFYKRSHSAAKRIQKMVPAALDDVSIRTLVLDFEHALNRQKRRQEEVIKRQEGHKT